MFPRVLCQHFSLLVDVRRDDVGIFLQGFPGKDGLPGLMGVKGEFGIKGMRGIKVFSLCVSLCLCFFIKSKYFPWVRDDVHI